MIRIHKNNETRVVTKGAYESFFKPLGYQIIVDMVEEKPKKVEKPKTEKPKNEGMKIKLPDMSSDKKEVE